MILLVVDMQKGIADSELHNYETFMDRTVRLIGAARENHVEVVFVQHDAGPESGLSAGDDDFEIVDQAAPEKGEKVFAKTINSCFGNKDFTRYMEQQEDKRLMIIGLQTNWCIDATVKSAFERGYQVIIPEGTNSTFDNDYMTGETTYRYYNEEIWPDCFAECVTFDEAMDMIQKEGQRMIYYQDDELTIRNMEEADAQVFFDEYTAQGWHPDIEYYRMRMREQAEGKCVALTAEYQGHPAGAVYLYLTVHEGPFKGKGWPMIVDFSVLKKYQRKGIGGRMMDAAEQIAGQYADTVCLGVGVCDSYGSAQRMYVKRGYIPDGSGVWYHDKQCVQYETVCTLDDDLVLYLSKKLR